MASAGLFFSLAIAGYFLGQSGLGWNEIVTAGLETLQEKILGANFLLFLLFFSVSLAFPCLASLKLGLRQSLVAIIIGSAPAILLSLALYPIAREYWAVLAILPFALMALAWNASAKLLEIKKFTRFRSFSAGIGMFTIIFAIGIILSGAMAIMPEQEKLLAEWEDSIAGKALGGGTELQEKLLKTNLDSQFNLLADIHGSEQYTELKKVEDERVEAFDAYFIELTKNVDKARKNTEGLVKGNEAGEIDMHSMLEEKIPLYGLFSEYFFLAYPFTIAMLVVSIGNILFRALGGGIALLLTALMKNI